MSLTEAARPLRRALRLVRHPFVDGLLLLAGLVLATVFAPLYGRELLLVQAGEMVLLALGRLALRRQMGWFFGGLLSLGVVLPLSAGLTAPIYYGGGAGVGSPPFFELAGLALLAALPLIAFAIWGLRRRAHAHTLRAADPGWLSRLEWGFEGAMLLIVLSLDSGQWSDLTVASVIVGAVVFAVGMVALLAVRLQLTRRGVGALLAGIGASAALICVVLVATQEGRVSGSEAALGVVPGLALLVAGLLVSLGLGRRDDRLEGDGARGGGR